MLGAFSYFIPKAMFRRFKRLRLLNHEAVGPYSGLPRLEEEAGTNRELRIACGPLSAQPIVNGIGLETDVPCLSRIVARTHVYIGDKIEVACETSTYREWIGNELQSSRQRKPICLLKNIADNSDIGRSRTGNLNNDTVARLQTLFYRWTSCAGSPAAGEQGYGLEALGVGIPCKNLGIQGQIGSND